MTDKIDDNKFLGKLCDHGHEYKNTGKTLRFKNLKRCVECCRIHRQKFELNRRQKKTTSAKIKTKARVYASIHCVHYRFCMDEAAMARHGGNEMECHKCLNNVGYITSGGKQFKERKSALA